MKGILAYMPYGNVPTPIGTYEGQSRYAADGFFFRPTTDEFGTEISITAGTIAGTEVINLNPGIGSSMPQLQRNHFP